MTSGLVKAIAGFSVVLAISWSLIGCAKTICGSSRSTAQEKGRYYTASSEQDRTIYFEKVKKHFQELGRQIDENELHQYTASIFILSVPPAVEVYDNGNYMGKTNASQLYFKPGKREIVFKKGDQENKKEIELVEGKNLSIVVKF